jgi:hypothetical protein
MEAITYKRFEAFDSDMLPCRAVHCSLKVKSTPPDPSRVRRRAHGDLGLGQPDGSADGPKPDRLPPVLGVVENQFAVGRSSGQFRSPRVEFSASNLAALRYGAANKV